MSEYRAVVKFATTGNYTVTLTSDWLPYEDMAEEVIDEFGSTKNEWGEVFDTKIERKEVVEVEGDPEQSPCLHCGSPSYKRICNDCDPKIRVAHMLLTARPDLLEIAAEEYDGIEIELED